MNRACRTGVVQDLLDRPARVSKQSLRPDSHYAQKKSGGTILTDGSRFMMTTQDISRHGERSEAIHGPARARPCRQWLEALALDGFVAALLAIVADQAQGTDPLQFEH
jgi:hypothetical protein